MNRANHPILPFVAALTGIFTFSLMDALMKSATLAAGAYSSVLLRSVLGAAMMLPVWQLTGKARWPARSVLKVHAARGLLSSMMATTFFYGLARIPMAEGMALSFIAPLIALYLAAVFLGEQIGRKAIFASLLGLAGVAVIAAGRWEAGGFGPDAIKGVAAILGSAVAYAANLVVQRHQAQLADPREIAFFQALFTSMFMAVALPWLFTMPSGRAQIDIVGAAVLASVSIMLLSWAYARAEAQVLIPTEYSAFIWAALMGWAMFAEAVTAATVAGVVLIVAACWIAARGHTEQTAL